MRHLHITFTDEEYKQIKRAKKQASKNWHDYILDLVLNNAKE